VALAIDDNGDHVELVICHRTRVSLPSSFEVDRPDGEVAPGRHTGPKVREDGRAIIDPTLELEPIPVLTDDQ